MVPAIAMAVSSSVFEGVLSIAVGAGILLAAAFMLTRRLWLSIGFHLAWSWR